MDVKRGDNEVWSYDSFLDVVTQPVTFPLPEHKNPAQCRDEFLKSIFATVERVVIKRPTTQRLQSVREESTTAEGMAILNMMKKSLIVPQFDSMSVSQYRASLTAEQMEKLYTVCLYRFQKAAIQFLSGRLKKQIDTLLQTWPGAVVELPHKLFHWSLEFFLHRQKVNQLYLDVLVMERSKPDLDCAKFCIDLNEIIRLLDLIREDFGEQRDICNTSSIINDSNYEVNSMWIKDLKNLRKIYHNLDAIIQSNTVRIPSQCGLELAAEDDRTEALSLIEMRYRSNWLRSCGDQTKMLLEKKELVYEEEIKELQKKMNLDMATSGFVEFVYHYSIDTYRAAISTWQERLAVDLEAAELQCNITRSLWVKAKDDLKFHQEEMEMFKRRVNEVMELIEMENLPVTRRRTRSSMSSRSRKSSIVGSLKLKKK